MSSLLTERAVNRFWSNVRKTDSCWLWEGYRNYGYGVFSVNRRLMRAHRVSWIMAHGEIPKGLCVLHHCDVPACVRPDHLFIGSQADNVLDCIKKGRHRQRIPTHCKNGHLLDSDNVCYRKNGWRRCRKCRNLDRARSRKRITIAPPRAR